MTVTKQCPSPFVVFGSSRCSAASCLFWLVLTSFVGQSDGKVQTGTIIQMGNSNSTPETKWQYLSKFGYTLGTGDYEIRVRAHGKADGPSWRPAPLQLDLELFLDEEWDRVESLPVCRRAVDGPARKTHRLSPGPVGEWGPWEQGQVIQVMRPHIWYFAVSNCEGGEETFDVDYEIHLRQFDDSELSIELRFMPSVSTAALIGLTVFSVFFIKRCRRFKQSAGRMHSVIQVLAIVVALQWIAQTLHTIHLWVYRANGVGAHRIDCLAEVAFMLSQAVSSTLLIAIGQGYTLSLSVSMAMDLAFVKPIAIAVAVLHVALVGVGKMQGDASDKYHENEGGVGLALVLVRMLLCGWFVFGVQKLRRKGSFRLQAFLQRFQIAGSAYFLAYPVICGVVQLFAPYLQHPLMHIGMHTMQTATVLWLADLFLSRGAYYEVSELSSALLPGGTGCCSPVELKKEK